MQSIYLETSIIGYLASRTSSDLVTAGNQTLTRDWWDNHREHFELVVSEAVIAECSAGDPAAAGVLSDANIEPPVICTPQEIINVQ